MSYFLSVVLELTSGYVMFLQQPDPIIDSEMLLITVALECIYACERWAL